MKKLFVIVVVILGLGGATYVVLTSRSEQPNEDSKTDNFTENTQTAPSEPQNSENITVTYDDNGFSPKAITIPSGTEVTFINNTQIPLYVASDPHPDHTDYEEFDTAMVQGRVPRPGENTQFVFDRRGEWGFHNHAAPEHTGTVTVN